LSLFCKLTLHVYNLIILGIFLCSHLPYRIS